MGNENLHDHDDFHSWRLVWRDADGSDGSGKKIIMTENGLIRRKGSSKMTLEQLIGTMKVEHKLCLCKTNGDVICECTSRSEGVIPYLKRTVRYWYVTITMEIVTYLEREDALMDAEKV